MSAYDVRGVPRTAASIRAEVLQWKAYLAQMAVVNVLAGGTAEIQRRIENLEMMAISRQTEEDQWPALPIS